MTDMSEEPRRKPTCEMVVMAALPDDVTIAASTDGKRLALVIYAQADTEQEAEDLVSGAALALYATLGEQLPDSLVRGE